MTIQESIKKHIEKRLEHTPALVVYDPDTRYADIVQSMASERCIVVDGRSSTILGREQAMDAWRSMALEEPEARRLIVYIPVRKPQTNEGRQRDPYQIFALGGGEFPENDGESYQALCRRAAPEDVDQIDQIFATGIPDFDTINNLIGGATNWPTLKTVLGAESAIEIIVSILSPTDAQRQALNESDAWVQELKRFLDSTLCVQLKTKGKQWSTVSEELWRLVLFSEFAFDLPEGLPEALKDVPRAANKCQGLTNSVCDQLRASDAHRERYLLMADRVAAELQLESLMEGVSDLGIRDTFAFEERSFLGRFAEAALQGKYDVAGDISSRRKDSVWVRHTERQQLWTMADRALKLIAAAEDMGNEVSALKTKAEAIFQFYCSTFRRLDSFHREFEQSVADALGELDTLEDLVETARKRYVSVAESLHARFIASVQAEGWPVSGQIRNTQVFDKFVAPWLKERKKVALFMVDALRYELALYLESELGRFPSEIVPVCAQLPTVTPMGMAALMPGAEGKLRLVKEKDALVPYVGDHKVYTPADRLAFLKSTYGDRCTRLDLDDLVSKKKLNIAETVHLLMVTTTDIDKFGEASPSEARRVLPGLIRKVISGINAAQKNGFDRVVIATDHGFVLFDDQVIGDVVPKPSGDWVAVKDRCLLGSGSGNSGVVVFKKEAVGIQGDFEDYAVPATFATFAKGNPYFHEGLSLQECVLPVISIDLAGKEAATRRSIPKIQLSYKGGATDKITTRRPMIEVAMFQMGWFNESVEFELTAYAKSDVVGEVAASAHVQPATNLVSIKPGQAIKVPLKMEEEFHGSFEVRATDPETGVGLAPPVKLKTDYVD